MHKYLRSIGFSHLESFRMLEEVLQHVEQNYDQKKTVEKADGGIFAELSKDFGYDCGISVCGEYDAQGDFHREYYFPYYRGQQGFASRDLVLERHIDKESYAGAYDDFNIGITLIFFLNNPAEYLRIMKNPVGRELPRTLAFSALSDKGKILLPIYSDVKERERMKKNSEKRGSLVTKAQSGDPEAIESLTMEDIDLFTVLSRRVQTEDIYSIISSTFMPCGVECDQYSIIGEITELNITRNRRTDERLYQMKVVSNDIPVDVCINERDLLGIPEVGRRFKGKIWLQGLVE
ncbi:MAG: DUF3881 family protein [Lachnospiraceae bacterium]|nr:DUF3881 family protein [Lachnospiraceae bacterium]